MTSKILYNKKINRIDIEVMAPAGNFESLQTAINANANAVYFGVGNLNMRAHSSVNFTIDDLEEIAIRCNKANVKSYLTVNTVLYEHDLAPIKKLLNKALKAKITAIIASDMAAIIYARQIGLEVHASTQLNISNIDAVKFYSQFVDVVVLARELNLNQIAAINRAIEREQIRGPKGKLIQIEIFVHGALCMAVSGKCYLSLHEFNASANRGACMQTCRRSYTLTGKEDGYQIDVENEYLMSPKDLCTIGFLNKILDAGVSVLKIEGRARSPEYVKRTVEIYSKAIDSIVDGTYNQQKIDKWKEKLGDVFNRGFWDGYYLGKKMGKWSHIYGSQATKRKIYAGKTTNFFAKIMVAEILLEASDIEIGDKILIIGNTTGTLETIVDEIRVDLQPVKKAIKGTYVSLSTPKPIRRNDKVYKIVNAEYASLI